MWSRLEWPKFSYKALIWIFLFQNQPATPFLSTSNRCNGRYMKSILQNQYEHWFHCGGNPGNKEEQLLSRSSPTHLLNELHTHTQTTWLCCFCNTKIFFVSIGCHVFLCVVEIYTYRYVCTYMDGWKYYFSLILFDRSDCIFYLFRWVFTNLPKKKQVGKLQVILFLVNYSRKCFEFFVFHTFSHISNKISDLFSSIRSCCCSLNSKTTQFLLHKNRQQHNPTHTHAHTSIHTYICKLADWETEIRRQKQKATIQKIHNNNNFLAHKQHTRLSVC